jgi:hypothetical protein
MISDSRENSSSEVDVFALEQLRREALLRRVADPRTKVRELNEAFDGLAGGSGLLKDLPDVEQLEHFLEVFGDIGDRVAKILDGDLAAIDENPEGAAILREMKERLEKYERESGVPEADRWCGPVERGRRSMALIDLEFEMQQKLRRQSRDGSEG